MTGFAEIAAAIAGITLIVTNLTALYMAIKNSGIISVVQQRLQSHDVRLTANAQSIANVALEVVPKEK